MLLVLPSAVVQVPGNSPVMFPSLTSTSAMICFLGLTIQLYVLLLYREKASLLPICNNL